MSVAFLTAAFAAKIGSASQKSVLVALADRADDKTGFCFPSVADLVDRTELDRKKNSYATRENEPVAQAK